MNSLPAEPVCRICLKPNVHLEPLDRKMKTKIWRVFRIRLKRRTNGLPNRICMRCLYLASMALCFVDMCLETEKKLKRVYAYAYIPIRGANTRYLLPSGEFSSEYDNEEELADIEADVEDHEEENHKELSEGEALTGPAREVDCKVGGAEATISTSRSLLDKAKEESVEHDEVFTFDDETEEINVVHRLNENGFARCRTCSMSLTMSDYEIHMDIEHNEEEDRLFAEMAEHNGSWTIDEYITPGDIPCMHCGRRFLSERCHRIHLKWHDNVKFRCRRCLRLFIKIQQVEEHHCLMRAHCDPNESIFQDVEVLEVYQKSEHSQVSKLPCKVCEQKFYSAAFFNAHLMQHYADADHHQTTSHSSENTGSEEAEEIPQDNIIPSVAFGCIGCDVTYTKYSALLLHKNTCEGSRITITEEEENKREREMSEAVESAGEETDVLQEVINELQEIKGKSEGLCGQLISALSPSLMTDYETYEPGDCITGGHQI